MLPLLLVHSHPGCRARGVITAGGLMLPCALGRSGVTRRKREGDGATPTGSFALRRVFYRPDRLPRPMTGLPVQALTPQMGWSDDPADPLYNRAVWLPRQHSHERLWRDDHLYDYIIVLGHNDDPVLRPMGSAIFLHLAKEGFAPTEGCMALSRGAMRRLLPRLGTQTRLTVRG